MTEKSEQYTVESLLQAIEDASQKCRAVVIEWKFSHLGLGEWILARARELAAARPKPAPAVKTDDAVRLLVSNWRRAAGDPLRLNVLSAATIALSCADELEAVLNQVHNRRY